jgi:DNA-binding IclR family transcriptional regulator
MTSLMTKNNLGTVARTTHILRYIVEANTPVSIKSVAGKLSLAPSSVHRLLHLLIEQGFVKRSASGNNYQIGTDFYRLASITVDKEKVPKIALPHMRRIVKLVDEFCMLNIYFPSERQMMIAETVSSSHPLGYGAEKFAYQTVAWGATGRSIIAFLTEEEVRKIYDEAVLSPANGQSLPDYQIFIEDLNIIRSRGYAHTIAQKMPGAIGIGVPIFGPGGVVGSLSLTVPETRFRSGRDGELLGALVDEARQINFSLGYRQGANFRHPALTGAGK